MIKRRTVLVVAVLIISCATFLLCFIAINKTDAQRADLSGITIVLDAGHGGIDCGVSGIKTKVKESELNLSVVKKLSGYLTDAGFNVVLTRNSDAGLYGVATKNLKRKDMEKRREIINGSGASLVISIHMNYYTLSSRRGAQVFYKGKDANGELLAKSVQSQLNGMEEMPRSCSPLTGDYYILNCSDIPSVIVECGFLSNPQDEELLITDKYQDSVAYTVFKGIVKYMSEASFEFTEK